MGLQPGPVIGEITKAVYEMQLDGRVGTLEDAKTVAYKMLSTDFADFSKERTHPEKPQQE
jgi:hypothetical protein